MQKLTSTPLKVAKKLSLELTNIKPLSEWISIYNCQERVIAKNITCRKNLPSFNNSALDGYAIKHEDAGKKLRILETIFAGDSKQSKLKNGECYKIMTGAKIPDDVDTIVAFENAQMIGEEFVQTPDNVKKGNAFRKKGEEVAVGEVLIQAGTMLGSSHVAYLASQGITQIEAYREISIAIFSTGNELKEPWESANEDEIYNVNSSALIALFAEFGFKADYCGVIPDNLEQSKEYFKHMKTYDVLVTTGGISMGEADFVEDALIANGLKSLFHGVNIKPGRPTMIGKMDKTIVASMPGNPLAAYVNAFLFLVPLLKKLQGNTSYEHKIIKAKMQKELKLKPNRANLVLGNFENGVFKTTLGNKYGSGMITPIVMSNALFVSNDNQALICEDEEIDIILLKGSF
jgi:molybdopterin molybdotransferase